MLVGYAALLPRLQPPLPPLGNVREVSPPAPRASPECGLAKRRVSAVCGTEPAEQSLPLTTVSCPALGVQALLRRPPALGGAFGPSTALQSLAYHHFIPQAGPCVFPFAQTHRLHRLGHRVRRAELRGRFLLADDAVRDGGPVSPEQHARQLQGNQQPREATRGLARREGRLRAAVPEASAQGGLVTAQGGKGKGGAAAPALVAEGLGPRL